MADTVTPPAAVQAAARGGLELRAEQPPSNRAGTSVGLRRAAQLANGQPVSLSTLKRMVSFFARHEVDKQGEGFKPDEDGYPSPGRVAWGAWGGDAGQTWQSGAFSIRSCCDRFHFVRRDEHDRLAFLRPTFHLGFK